MENSRFSICIPNYNYGIYLDKTLNSVKAQTFQDYEVVIADNNSTDNSLEVIEKWAKTMPNLSFKQNLTNIGFAGNLDICGGMATGDWMVLLSSDDIINPNALEVYNQLIQIVEKEFSEESFVISSNLDKIGSNDEFIECIELSKGSIYKVSDIDKNLSEKLGLTVYKVKTDDLLNRCFHKFCNPFNFAAACYPSTSYKMVGGYGGSRIMNPDKWFHWRILSKVDYAYIIDKPLFKYRWHNSNQTAQLNSSGELKFWIDEYRNCYEPDASMLNKAGLTKDMMKTAFCTHLLKYVVVAIKEKDKNFASRLFKLGQALYPNEFYKNKLYPKVLILLKSYPLSTILLKKLLK